MNMYVSKYVLQWTACEGTEGASDMNNQIVAVVFVLFGKLQLDLQTRNIYKAKRKRLEKIRVKRQLL